MANALVEDNPLFAIVVDGEDRPEGGACFGAGLFVPFMARPLSPPVGNAFSAVSKLADELITESV